MKPLLDLNCPDAPPGASPSSEHIVNLFALIDGAASCAIADGECDPSIQPVLHRAGPIAALIGMVPVADYCGADAARRLGDLAWLAPRTTHHAAVLCRAMQYSPVYPAPFGTLFTSLESLTEFMLAHAEALGVFFRAVAGMAEWELKASARLDDRSALEAVARETWPDWPQLAPGTRHLRISRDRPGLVAIRRDFSQDMAARLARRLLPPASSLRERVVQPGSQADGGELVGRFALLVPLDGAEALAQQVQSLAGEAADEGIALALSGPWPPFSFRPDLPRSSSPLATAE